MTSAVLACLLCTLVELTLEYTAIRKADGLELLDKAATATVPFVRRGALPLNPLRGTP